MGASDSKINQQKITSTSDVTKNIGGSFNVVVAKFPGSNEPINQPCILQVDEEVISLKDAENVSNTITSYFSIIA